MSMRRYPGLAAVVSSLLLAAPGVATAQEQAAKAPSKVERQAARDAYDKGTKAFEKGDYVTALDSFVKANALIPSVQAMFWIARAQDKLGNSAAALEAYEAITWRADFSKLSEDKAATVRERLATLKAAAAPPPAPPPEPEPVAPGYSEPEPTPPPPPLPPVVTPPPSLDHEREPLPQRNTAELGVLGGVMFVSNSHGLAGAEAPHHDFEMPSWQVGLRAAFFPEKVFGIEAEWAHGFGSVEGGGSAQLDSLRAHLIGQLPTNRFVPFGLIGAGILRADVGNTADLGYPSADTDFLLQAGIGFKVMATKLLVPRLDLRLGMTQAEGGGFTDGIALHPEILLGMSFTLGR